MKVKSEYSCSKHGVVEMKSTIEIDKYGFGKAFTVCPKCGKPTLLSTSFMKK